MKTCALVFLAVGLAGCEIESRWNTSDTTEKVKTSKDGASIVSVSLPQGGKRVFILDKDGRVIGDKEYRVEPSPPPTTAVIPKVHKTEVIVKEGQIVTVRPHSRKDVLTSQPCRMPDGRHGQRGWRNGIPGCFAPKG